ncbi:MAG: CAP domain-containing protein [Flavobacteriaceae bacterium]|nr:CAP domain-containing protein [Flavobacteriaceae bacterium]
MKFLHFNLVSIILFSLLSSCSNDDNAINFDQSSTIIDDSKVEYSAIESEILDLINTHRKSIGIADLTPLNIISSIADGHTEYMIKVCKLSHDNFAKRFQDLVENTDAKLVAENVAYGYSSSQGVVNGWLNSQTHKDIIENPKFTHFGISTESCKITNKNYFTQIFIRKE